MRLIVLTIVSLIAFASIFFVIARGFAKTPSKLAHETAMQSPEWLKKAIIYKIFIRNYTEEGNLNAIIKRFSELKQYGTTVICLSSIFPCGEPNDKSMAKNPYAISDFRKISPDIGSEEDLRNFIKEAHQEGFKVILDFVAGATALDSSLCASHPEFYKKDKEGKIQPFANEVISDMAMLDMENPATQAYLLDSMKYWVSEFGIDGFNCILTEAAPLSFWEQANKALHEISKEPILFADGGQPNYHLHAFSLTPSRSMSEVISDVISGEKKAGLLESALETEMKYFPQNSLRVRFNNGYMLNPFAAPKHTDAVCSKIAKLKAVLTFTLGGFGSIRAIPMIYGGEEVGLSLPAMARTEQPLQWESPCQREFQDLYRKLGFLRNTDPLFIYGKMVLVKNSKEESVFAFTREYKGKKALVVVNLSGTDFAGFLKVEPARILNDYLEPDKQNTTKDGNMKLTLPPFGYKIYFFGDASGN
ncbi:alpha amylase catalytic region [Chloroherpeton thalassium ATCC 35110]|uniref:Alpha amylase catalytic region n=1 Tax=Chloroherpeton thalassium (strain ATCC 35110 / GB-78) TaxID=517418 RepID=B3QV30_CHLT3|nr:alpha-amylase family glycosyl hydrolase [Chloroherpeton thalassium]ACF12984.1 alpha amylase catalytic region [Chloroherpeton thalassium ATCC 35110]